MIINYFKKKNNVIFYSIIFSTILFINFVYFYLNFNSSINVSDYAFNELFINYQSGLIRRGLLGEVFWQFNKIFGINPKSFFSILFLILYLIQCYLFFKLSSRLFIFKIIFISIIFSPALILFHIYDQNMYFVKDVFIKLSFLIHSYLIFKLLVKNKNNSEYFFNLKFIILPIIFLTIIIHEYQIFYISLHILVSLSVIKNNFELKKIFKIYSLLLIPFIFVIVFFGDQNQFEDLSRILLKFDVDLNPHLGGGIIKYLGAFYKWHFFYFSYRDFLNLFVSAILSIFVFYSLFQYLIDNKIINVWSKYQKKYLLFFIPTLIPILLTTDHGRNISLISFHLVVYFLTLNFNMQKLNKFKTEIDKKIIIKMMILLLVFFYIFMWRLDQYAGFGLRGIPNDIFKSSLFAEIIKFIKFIYIYIDHNIFNLPEIKL